MTDPQAIAARLSEAQREWIKAMPTIPTSMSERDFNTMPELFVEMVPPDPDDGFCGELAWIGAGVASKPVGPDWYYSAWLTDAGLAVRSILGESNG